MTRSFWAGVILGMSVIVAGSGLLLSAHAADEKPKGQGMLYELRTYYTPEGKLDALNDRFRQHTMKLFEKHGMKKKSVSGLPSPTRSAIKSRNCLVASTTSGWSFG